MSETEDIASEPNETTVAQPNGNDDSNSSSVKLYISSVSSNREIKSKQQYIISILSSQKIEYEEIDIAVCSEEKDKMRELIGDPTALPPRLFKGDKYLGDYAAFEEAVETKALDEFFAS